MGLSGEGDDGLLTGISTIFWNFYGVYTVCSLYGFSFVCDTLKGRIYGEFSSFISFSDKSAISEYSY